MLDASGLCGQRLVASGLWPVACGQWLVASGLWPVTCGLWPVACGQWPVACCQWPVARGQIGILAFLQLMSNNSNRYFLKRDEFKTSETFNTKQFFCLLVSVLPHTLSCVLRKSVACHCG